MVDHNIFVQEYRGMSFAVRRMNEYWHECRTLFQESDPDDFEVMQNIGNHFWGVSRESLLEVLLMYINKITDPHESSGRKNLTLGRILWSARSSMQADQYLELINVYRNIKSISGPFRGWRNKWYQHLDCDLIVNDLTRIDMPPIPGAEIIKMIDLINLFMTSVSSAADDFMNYSALRYQGDGTQILDKLRSV